VLSVVYITCRPPLCVGNFVSAAHNLVWVPEPEPNHYRLLAASLAAQTFTDYELIVVDESNDLPRPELAVLGDHVRYLRPRVTPWRALGAFAASVARNTGVLAACGDVIVGLDDCVSFGPDLLEQVAIRAERGSYLVLHLRPSEEGPNPEPPFDVPRARAGGLLAYPREVALAIRVHEEKFTGVEALEDWEFSERLVRSGVRLVSSAGRVTLHGHARTDRAPQRCCHAVRELVAGQACANQPWTPEQIDVFRYRCPFQTGVERRANKEFPLCAITANGRCDHPERPSGAALAIMQTYESSPWLSL
jgi:hypothetical protein